MYPALTDKNLFKDWHEKSTGEGIFFKKKENNWCQSDGKETPCCSASFSHGGGYISPPESVLILELKYLGRHDLGAHKEKNTLEFYLLYKDLIVTRIKPKIYG